MTTSLGFGFDDVERSVSGALQTNENKLAQSMSSKSQSTEDLLKLQMDLSKWSISVNVQSSIVKELSDALKGILQKSA